MGRLNTFRIDFGTLPNKPGLVAIQKFCTNELGLKRGDVIRLQNSRALGVTFVTVLNLEVAREIVEEHGRMHFITGSDGKKYPLTLTLEDGAVEVKLYDLSDDVTNADIVEFLGKFGTVRHVHEEQLGEDQDFPGAYTGVRVAKMVVDQNIDSWVTIRGELTQVTYFGQRQTCRHCRDFLHIGASCVQNKKLQVQKSYADAAKQPAKPKNAGTPNNPNPIGRQEKRKSAGGRTVPPPRFEKETQGGKPLNKSPPNEQANVHSKPVSEFLVPATPSASTSASEALTSGMLTGGATDRRNTAEKHDGNDTDTSAASSTSSRSKRGRPPGKKLRGDDNEREEADKQ